MLLRPLVPVDYPLDLLILLILGHFVGDYSLQGDKMAIEKCPGKDVTIDWRWWLTAHTSTHGLIVALFTGVPLLGLAELAAHFLIDYGKCRIHYSLLIDQSLHLLCKVLWVAILVVLSSN